MVAGFVALITYDEQTIDLSSNNAIRATTRKILSALFTSSNMTRFTLTSIFAIILYVSLSTSSAVPSINRNIQSTPILRMNLGSRSEVDGFTGDDNKYSFGSSRLYTGNLGNGIYQSHRSGKHFGFAIDDIPQGLYDVTVHMNENWPTACHNDVRVFSITVGSQTIGGYDAFRKAGCNVPIKEAFHRIIVTDVLRISLDAISQNAFISGLEVVRVDDVSSPSPTAAEITSLKLNVGATSQFGSFIGDNGRYVIGTSTPYTLGGGTGIYGSHRAGKSFSVVVDLEPGLYNVILHFEESWVKACAEGYRVFSVNVANKPFLIDYDVFAKVGCLTSTTETLTSVNVQDTLKIDFVAQIQNAFVSGVEIALASGNTVLSPSPIATFPFVSDHPTPVPQVSEETTPSVVITTPSPATSEEAQPSPTPSASKAVIKPLTSTVQVNLGSPVGISPGYIGDDGITYRTGTSKPSIRSGDGIYASHIWGASFGLEFLLDAPGMYDVTLHFYENYLPACKPSGRVFTITIGGQRPLVNYDVFSKVGCETPISETFTAVEVTEQQPKIQLHLEANIQNAFISAVSIKPTEGTPSVSPIPSPEGSGDKGAHAVPPVYDAPFVDLNKDGKEIVTMDGSGSHSHAFDTETRISGTVTNFKWTNKDTKDILCEGPTASLCTSIFPLGSTMISLCVKDNFGSEHCAMTTIVVVKSIANGIYCYYYDFKGTSSADVPIGLGLEAEVDASPKPLYGRQESSAVFTNLASFPNFPFRGGIWAQRCIFFYKATSSKFYNFSVKHIGGVALYVGEEQVLRKEASSPALATLSTKSIELPEGMHKIELLYFKTGEFAQLEFAYDGPTVQLQHDKATVLPLITSISPGEGNLLGGQVKISGLSIDKNTEALFGFQRGSNAIFKEPSEVIVQAPVVRVEQDVMVVLSNRAGTSNSVTFEYKADEPPPIEFTQTKFQHFQPDGVTGIAIGPDFKYYMSTLSGKVIVASVDHERGYLIKENCQSDSMFDPRWINHKTGNLAPRWILGLAFDPQESQVKLYVGTGTLFWGASEGDYLNDDFAWANGNIEILEPGNGCLKRNKILITGLPVSNHDHSINGMVFDNQGDLHFQIGGFTNQGVAAPKLGGFDENPLSAASLVALTSKGLNFDGDVRYDNKNPGLAKKISGDVFVYSSGLRNSFGLVLHSNGRFYATDNGPNLTFGSRSVTCSSQAADKAHSDKILQLKKGKYYGSPNRNRGECVFIDDNNKTPDGGVPPPELNYEPRLAKIEASTNGIAEYTAATFESQLRGSLFVSKFAASGAGKVFRIGLNANGGLDSGPDPFFNFPSGLSICQGKYCGN